MNDMQRINKSNLNECFKKITNFINMMHSLNDQEKRHKFDQIMSSMDATKQNSLFEIANYLDPTNISIFDEDRGLTQKLITNIILSFFFD